MSASTNFGIDAIPQNIILDQYGNANFIDLEWKCKTNFKLGFMVWRTLTNLVASIPTDWVVENSDGEITRLSFMKNIINHFGMSITDQEIQEYITEEKEFQDLVSFGVFKFEDWLDTPINSLVPCGAHVEIDQISKNLNDQLVKLEESLFAREEKIVQLQQNLNACEEKIVELEQVLKVQEKVKMTNFRMLEDYMIIFGKTIFRLFWQISRRYLYTRRVWNVPPLSAQMKNTPRMSYYRGYHLFLKSLNFMKIGYYRKTSKYRQRLKDALSAR